MELVYLWVEDYKNIKRQGFNFSPKLECEYNDNTNELTINEKKDYVNIFPENVNVTAIVGENGSGKSSILEALTFLYWRTFIKDHRDRTFFIYENKGTFHIQCDNYKSLPISENCLTNFIKINNNTAITSPKIFSARGQMPLIAFSNCISDVTYTKPLHNLKEYSNFYNGIQPTAPMMKSQNIYDNFNQKFQYLLNKDICFFNFINENFIFNSFQLEIHFSELEASILQYSNEKLQKLLTFQNLKINDEKDLVYRLISSLAIDATSVKLSEDNSSKLFDQSLFEHEIAVLLTPLSFNVDTFNKIITKCKDSLSTIEETLDNDIFNNANVNDILEKFSIVDTKKGKSYTILKNEIFSIENESENIIIENKLLKYLLEYKILRFNFMNSKDNSYSFLDLSSGEKLYLNVLTNYAYTLFKLKDNYHGVMMLDEIELSFHPNWQKQLIKHIIYIHKKISKDKAFNIHLILTSHSPLILSDLPKDNVIFLKNGKQVDVNINPFGANIHTLLSHGFFMEGGLMGEFAKEKINEIIEILKKEQLSDDEVKNCKNIISIIGEPILQKTLQHQLNGKLNPNENELQKLEREQKEIQEKIAKLTRDKNETD